METWVLHDIPVRMLRIPFTVDGTGWLSIFIPCCSERNIMKPNQIDLICALTSRLIRVRIRLPCRSPSGRARYGSHSMAFSATSCWKRATPSARGAPARADSCTAAFVLTVSPKLATASSGSVQASVFGRLLAWLPRRVAALCRPAPRVSVSNDRSLLFIRGRSSNVHVR